MLASTPTEITPSWFLLHKAFSSHACICKVTVWISFSVHTALSKSAFSRDLGILQLWFLDRVSVQTPHQSGHPSLCIFCRTNTTQKLEHADHFVSLSSQAQRCSVGGASERQPLCCQPEKNSLFGNRSLLLLFLGSGYAHEIKVARHSSDSEESAHPSEKGFPM